MKCPSACNDKLAVIVMFTVVERCADNNNIYPAQCHVRSLATHMQTAHLTLVQLNISTFNYLKIIQLSRVTCVMRARDMIRYFFVFCDFVYRQSYHMNEL